jgi:hypothetical protein
MPGAAKLDASAAPAVPAMNLRRDMRRVNALDVVMVFLPRAAPEAAASLLPAV